MQPKTPAPTVIERILARFEGAQREYVSGVQSDAADRIDDGNVAGAYGDPLADPRPAFVREDERGWRRVVSLKR